MSKFEESYLKFEDFVREHDMIRENDKEIIVAYSGGKDASLMCDFLHEYKKRTNPDLKLKLVVARFPHFLFETTDKARAEIIDNAFDYWKSRGFDIELLDHDSVSPEGFLESENPCKICARIKTELMGRYIRQYPEKNKVFCLGMNFDDCLSWLMEVVLLSSNYGNIDEVKDSDPELYRYIKTLLIRTTHLLEDEKNNIRFIRPIISFTNSEISELVKERELPLIPEECREISKKETFRDSPRRELSLAIEAMRMKYNADCYDGTTIINNYDRVYRFAQTSSLFPGIKDLNRFMADSLMI